MRSPGMFTVMEALLRSNIGPQPAGNVFDHISVPLALFNYVLDPNQTTKVLPACLSLAGTIRKIMYPVTHGVFSGAIPNTLLNPAHVNTLTYMHIQLINTMNDSQRAEGGRNVGGSGKKRGSGCSSSRSRLTADTLPLSCTALVVQGVADEAQTAPRLHTAAERHHLYHNVQAVMMAAVLQLCHYRVEASLKGLKEQGGLPVWRRQIFTWLDSDTNGLQGILKARLLRLQMQKPATAQQEIGPYWEAYAREKFDGRMLPGCGHLGCTDLTGVAEAALPTLLCGGCKQARYCCVKCQRGAWLEGHNAFCGK